MCGCGEMGFEGIGKKELMRGVIVLFLRSAIVLNVRPPSEEEWT